MKKIKIIFFGSFQHYSTIILERLIKSNLVDIVGVVTTPPMPAGRKKILKKTHVHEFAEKNNLKIFIPETLDEQYLIANLACRQAGIQYLAPDLFLTAGYGKLLPKSWLDYPKLGSLNLHFSLLPKYRGANPAEWAILNGEKETGITLIEMSEKFDQGAMLAQAKISINDNDTRETVYEKLYKLGADKLAQWLLDYSNNKLTQTPQGKSPTPYAKRLKRQDGFIAWEDIKNAMENYPVETRHSVSQNIARKVRALTGFPGVWTLIPTKNNQRRMKILSCKVKENKLILEKVQIEGQDKANWNQVKNIVIS
ncbi:MAG: methionyl-tRNA formyltransferase [Patescibacteria group bacterium]